MADPIRAALERLVGDIQEARDCIEGWGAYASEYFQQKHDLAGDLAAFDRKIAAARAALANSDGPAVPEGREPASVVGKSSDENCWQWYTYCPEEGLEMYSDRKQAQSAAQSIMGSYEVAAHSDGWHEDMELVSWGMLVPVEQAQVVERKTAEPGDEFDEWVKYELRPVRWGHQPAPPAEGEVAELVAQLTSRHYGPGALDRAAELLEQLSAPVVGEGNLGCRSAMVMAISTLEGWANYGEWVWPESALEQAKKNTTETIAALRAALAAAPEDGPAVPEQGGGPTQDELWELWLRLNNELPDRPAAVAEFWEHAQINALAHRGRPAPAPVVGEPSDEELELIVIAIQALTPHQPDVSSHDLAAVDRGREILRNALARWGRPTIPPAPTAECEYTPVAWCRSADFANAAAKRQSFSGWRDPHSDCDMAFYAAPPQPVPAAGGEVAELVAWLGVVSEQFRLAELGDEADQTDRAATLLAQLQAAPVPVAERLPGAVNTHFEFIISDADYCTQAGGIAPTYAQALSEGQRFLAQYQQDGPHTLELRRIEVLHPSALPLPQGEVE